MNIYVPPNGAVEDLVNTLEALKPGMVSSRLVLEVSTEDKGLAMLLRKISGEIPDEMNADSLVAQRSRPERKTRKARTPKSAPADGFPE